MKSEVTIFWFRRDLRLEDNAGLYHALKSNRPVVPVFIFDRSILDELEEKIDRRVEFIHQSLQEIQKQLQSFGSTLDVRYGFPLDVYKELAEEYEIREVFANHDYEPYANERDHAIAEFLGSKGIFLRSYKDQVIFEKSEVIKDDGKPYTVFTPYSKRWKSIVNDFYLKSYPTHEYFENFYKQARKAIPSLASMGLQSAEEKFPSKKWDQSIIENYSTQRDFPATEGTSRLSVHLRFGTISIRELVRETRSLNETFLNELIWREFYQMILWHFPQVVHQSFKPEYDRIQWRNNEKEFEAWCNGQTGYPIVDAGMRQLNETGYMHNRVRMITASFLTRHLLIDWRWGESYFAKKLLDYDLAANNGGWQWAAGTGCDAAPYFRIFNPYIQTKKFDPELKYVKKWVPEFEDLNYPAPIVEHEFARKRCLEVYSKALKK
jgi:deoxyribodipyrimidine photo-lyase